MKHNISLFTAACSLFLLLGTACSESAVQSPEAEPADVMNFQVNHPWTPAPTRVTETAFESGDQVGLYITDTQTLLEPGGNYVNNAPLRYDNAQWTTPKPIYWNQGTYNVYAYYPYATPIVSTSDYPFTIATDQSGAGYAQSDFLWARKDGVTAQNGAVNLQFSHRMSRILIKLVPGKDFEGELPTDAEVYLHSTVPAATIDLSAGIVTRNNYTPAQIIRAKSLGNHKYTAILVPQRLDNKQPLVEVIMKGVSYLYESRFVFKPGIQHMVQLIISKNPEQIKIEIGGEIENWS